MSLILTDVIVLNGGSSSGKSSIARCLQELLPSPWLRLGIDDLIGASPLHLVSGPDASLAFAPDGSISVGVEFAVLERAWHLGLAAIANAGVGVIVEDVFLGGSASQGRLESALSGLHVFWVAVRCDAHVAATREATRLDRVAGMALAQARSVHEGVVHDLQVDTTVASSLECAGEIVSRLSV